MKAKIGIDQMNTGAAAKALSVILADEFILCTKTRNAHWNVEGANFHTLHLFFESQYEQLDKAIDQVAERIRALAFPAPGSLKGFLQLTRLKEEAAKRKDSTAFINELLQDHENIILYLRGLIDRFADEWKDAGSSDFVTGLMETHEKMAWMLKAHLELSA